MNKFIEKLIERLEEIPVENRCCECPHRQKCDEVQENINNDHTDLCGATIKALAIEIVNQLAEEYNNGWIPYATGAELPLNNQKVWLSFTSQYTSFVKSAWWVNDHFEWNNGRTVKDVPLAWKPYNVPEPYQPKGE